MKEQYGYADAPMSPKGEEAKPQPKIIHVQPL